MVGAMRTGLPDAGRSRHRVAMVASARMVSMVPNVSPGHLRDPLPKGM
jgi:hypothetical protein